MYNILIIVIVAVISLSLIICLQFSYLRKWLLTALETLTLFNSNNFQENKTREK